MSDKIEHVPEHVQLMREGIWLMTQGKHAEAGYLIGISLTDMAEANELPVGRNWPRPGQIPPQGWHVYERAFRWFHGGRWP
ncbi:hypothetical protein [Geminicoccus harenae]|uniref:hypothetical protein n=1 Tax=Geminicoccus harenae TaxID=2498453 RepID=UPI00168AA271|nr:hypothetical protein [Geminicoccus harenae]